LRKPTGLRIVEYATADGTRIKLEVSPEIALALAGDADNPGSRLKEVTFTDLAKRKSSKEEGVPTPDSIDEKTAHRRVDQRPMPTGEPWEGPRFHFDVVLGTGRTTWFGGRVYDEAGRCGICHDRRLSPSTYCGSCDRCGRDREIPRAVPKPLDVQAPEDDGRKGGVGTGKTARAETRKERRARERLERERKAG
jgi:hypothetical protein